jgi:hypothetical protein
MAPGDTVEPSEEQIVIGENILALPGFNTE